MKTIDIPPQEGAVNALLAQASQEDLLVRTADGTRFMVTAIDDFDEEIVRTRRNAKLMALLDERGTQSKTISLKELKQELEIEG
jgi:hypothetical protein